MNKKDAYVTKEEVIEYYKNNAKGVIVIPPKKVIKRATELIDKHYTFVGTLVEET